MRIMDWSSDVCSSDLAGADEGQRRKLFAGRHRNCDRDGRVDGTEVVRRPPDKAKDRAGTKGHNAGAAAQYPLGGDAAEADPLFVAALDPGQFDLGQTVAMGRRRNASAVVAGADERSAGRFDSARHQASPRRAGCTVPTPGSEVDERRPSSTHASSSSIA